MRVTKTKKPPSKIREVDLGVPRSALRSHPVAAALAWFLNFKDKEIRELTGRKFFFFVPAEVVSRDLGRSQAVSKRTAGTPYPSY